MAVFRVEKNNNYTVMSNYHLSDTNLSLKAIGLLSKMLSLPNNWDYTLKGLAAICKEGVGSVESTVNELISAGYIIRVKVRNKSGCFEGYDYDVHEIPVDIAFAETGSEKEMCRDNPDTESPDMGNPDTGNPDTGNPYTGNPDTGNPDTGNPDTGNPYTGNPDTGNPDTDEPYTENPAQLNTNIPNTKTINTNPIKSYPRADQDMSDEEYEQIIKTNIDYDVFTASTEPDGDQYRELYEIMYETVTTRDDEIVVGKKVMSTARVRARLLELDSSDLEYVLLAMKDTKTKIHNIRQYLLAALYNAKNTKNLYYSQRVNREQF